MVVVWYVVVWYVALQGWHTDATTYRRTPLRRWKCGCDSMGGREGEGGGVSLGLDLESGESREERVTVAAAVWLSMRNRVLQQIT